MSSADNAPPPGRAKVSLSLNAAQPQTPDFTLPFANAQTLGKRPRTMFGGADDEDNDDDKPDTAEQITSFGGDGPARPAPAAPTIAPLPDTRAWGSRTKRQKSTLPNTQQPSSSDAPPAASNSPPKFGLQLQTHRRASPSPSPTPATAPEPEQSEDAAALARLTGATDAPGTHATILSEDAAYDRDAAAASHNPTLADYAATPIAGFGAALMRGSLPAGQTIEGWKSSAAARARAAAGSKRIDRDGNMVAERRADLLGLGAKELDLGDAGKDKKKSTRRQAMEYEPLARRNVKTGEVISEAEFREKVEGREEGAERERHAGRERRREEPDRRQDGRRERDGRDRERDRDRDYRRDRDSERRKDREYDSRKDRESDRRKERDYESKKDRDYGSRKDRDADDRHPRRHRDERERERDSDRRSHRDRDRDRHRDHSRDRRRDRR